MLSFSPEIMGFELLRGRSCRRRAQLFRGRPERGKQKAFPFSKLRGGKTACTLFTGRRLRGHAEGNPEKGAMPDTSQRPRIVPVAFGKTDVGRQREHNEDQFLVLPEIGLFVVCDGMGGNNAGEVASALATTSLRNFYQATEAGGPVPGKL